MAVLYLRLQRRYSRRAGDALIPSRFVPEAIRLRDCCGNAAGTGPGTGCAAGADAAARRPARTRAPIQRGRWCRWPTRTGRSGIARRSKKVARWSRRRLLPRPPGPYALEAAIAAVHSELSARRNTGLGADRALYDRLHRAASVAGGWRSIARSPSQWLSALRRAAAGGRAICAARGYHLWHATRADLLRRLGRREQAGRRLPESAGIDADEAASLPAAPP